MAAALQRAVMWYGGVGVLTGQVARSVVLPPKYYRLVVREIEIMGVRSLGVAATAALFTGMVFALQSAINMARFGAENYVGPLVALAILRELGPVLTAILVGGKVASGITAELGSMKVTEQIDALRSLGVNHVKRLRIVYTIDGKRMERSVDENQSLEFVAQGPDDAPPDYLAANGALQLWKAGKYQTVSNRGVVRTMTGSPSAQTLAGAWTVSFQRCARRITSWSLSSEPGCSGRRDIRTPSGGTSSRSSARLGGSWIESTGKRS